MGLIYLSTLLVSLACMLLLDWRYRLFFWHDARTAVIVTGIGTVFFLAWDFAGIGLGIFFRGEGLVATGILLAPELPLEEPVFLVFLVVCTMVLYTGAVRLLSGRSAARERSAGEEVRPR